MAEQLYYGIYPGIVTKTNDPEKRGRIKCQIPDVLGADTESAWCEPCIPVAYDTGGDFCMPQKKEAVWIMFHEGDPNEPVWLGGWWQEKKTPLGNNYTNLDDIRIISYANCLITMKKGTITINIGGGGTELKIDSGNISINGNLSVIGNISAYGTVHGSNI